MLRGVQVHVRVEESVHLEGISLVPTRRLPRNDTATVHSLALALCSALRIPAAKSPLPVPLQQHSPSRQRNHLLAYLDQLECVYDMCIPGPKAPPPPAAPSPLTVQQTNPQ